MSTPQAQVVRAVAMKIEGGSPRANTVPHKAGQTRQRLRLQGVDVKDRVLPEVRIHMEMSVKKDHEALK
jgi:hypothetical protein